VKVEGAGCANFINGKFTCAKFGTSSKHTNSVKDACLLTNKGNVVDTLKIAYLNGDNGNDDNVAYLLTSCCSCSSNSSTPYSLYDMLDKTVFPLDQVTLSDLTSTARIFGVIAPDPIRVERIFARANILDAESFQKFSSDTKCRCVQSSNGCILLKGMQLFDNQYTYCYTLIVPEQKEGEHILKNLNKELGDDENNRPPLEIAASEYESLRIEVSIYIYMYRVYMYVRSK
jgi:hypothetical protein